MDKELEKYRDELIKDIEYERMKNTLTQIFDILKLAQNNTVNTGEVLRSSSSGCAGTYPVSSYTRSDGTEVSGYMRTCGAAHNGGNNSETNIDSENDWDYVNPDDLDEYLDKELLEDYYKNRSYVQEGRVEESKMLPLQGTGEMYSNDNLTKNEVLQKNLTQNLPTDKFIPAQDYYKISLDLANNPSAVKNNERNSFYKAYNLPDFVNKKIVYNKIAKSMNINMDNPENKKTIENTMVVIPNENAPIVKLLKNSNVVKNFIVKNYQDIKSGKLKGKLIEGGMQFNLPSRKLDIINVKRFLNNTNLFAVLHTADVYDVKKNEDGSISLVVSDFYDFDYLDTKSNDSLKTKAVNHINNNAFHQQAAQQLKPYSLYIQITISKKELEKMLYKPRK